MPDATPDQPRNGQHPGRDSYDKANTFILACTLIAAGCAAGFTGWQAWIARDQEHRALRAYVVVKTELEAGRGGKLPRVKFTAENMGQTPVYDLFFATKVFAEDVAKPESMKHVFLDCKEDAARQKEIRGGQTFSKEASATNTVLSFTRTIGTMDDAFGNLQRVVAYGRVCYRDIFREVHSVRLCYEWASPDRGPDKCLDKQQADQDY